MEEIATLAKQVMQSLERAADNLNDPGADLDPDLMARVVEDRKKLAEAVDELEQQVAGIIPPK
jgi:hypothetical protein